MPLVITIAYNLQMQRLKDQPIKIDQLIRSKRKTVSVEVHRDGKVIVRASLHTPEKQILAWVESRAEWIRNAQKHQSARVPFHPMKYADGELFWYLGRQYPLSLVKSNSPALTFVEGEGFRLAKAHQADAQALFVEWYREQIRQITAEWIKRYQVEYGFKVGKLRITSARTHWGSCSGGNNLNFTYRLCKAQPSAIEYVVVHELVHTRIKNHSTKFWHVVMDVYPDYKQEQAYLKLNADKFSMD